MKTIALVFLLISSFFSLSTKDAFAAPPEPIIETVNVYQLRGEGDEQKKCNFFSSCVQAGSAVYVELSGIAYNNGTPFPDGKWINIGFLPQEDGCQAEVASELGNSMQSQYPENGSVGIYVSDQFVKQNCTYKIEIELPKFLDVEGSKRNVVSYPISSPAMDQCGDSDDQCKTNLDSIASYELCSQIKKDTDQYEACQTCFRVDGIWTAIGCIPSNPESVIKTVITIGLAAGGGIVLIMILVGSFMLSVSQGDPNKTKEAKEIITSAIIGLLFVIFSVTILQFIGVEILHIPGFGES